MTQVVRVRSRMCKCGRAVDNPTNGWSCDYCRHKKWKTKYKLKTITLYVPEEMNRQIRIRASECGMTLSGFILMRLGWRMNGRGTKLTGRIWRRSSGYTDASTNEKQVANQNRRALRNEGRDKGLIGTNSPDVVGDNRSR